MSANRLDFILINYFHLTAVCLFLYPSFRCILFCTKCRAQDKSEFAPVHLNHADKGTPECNVIRLLEDGRVAFFTSRDIIPGEEMCFNYGANFWKGREGDKI